MWTNFCPVSQGFLNLLPAAYGQIKYEIKKNVNKLVPLCCESIKHKFVCACNNRNQSLYLILIILLQLDVKTSLKELIIIKLILMQIIPFRKSVTNLH